MFKQGTSALLILILLTSMMLGGITIIGHPREDPIRVAVLDFEMPQGSADLSQYAPDLSRIITNRIEAGLVNLRAYQMVERTRITSILQEQNLASAGRIDPETAAKVGRILGVDAVIYGTVDEYQVQGMRTDQDYTVNDLSVVMKIHYKLTNTTTGNLLISEDAGGGAKKVTPNDNSKTTKKVLGMLLGNKGTLNSRPDPREVTERCKQLTDTAVGEAVGKIINRIQEAKVRQDTNPNKLAGQIIRVSANTVYITGIDSKIVKVGEKLSVRRLITENDGAKKITFTEIVGEVEIMDIQEMVLVGRFSTTTPEMKPTKGDIVTNPK